MAKEDWEKQAAANLAFLAGQMKRDLENAYILLAGRVVPTDLGINKIEYLRQKGPEEREARLSVARLLRSDKPLDHQLRQHLAALFDPEEDTYPGGERRLLFTYRRRPGRYRDNFRNSQIAEYIRGQRKAGLTVEKAIEAATDKFGKLGLREDMIRKIWNAHRRLERRYLIQRI